MAKPKATKDTFDPKDKALMERLEVIRSRKDLKLPPNKILREKIVGLDGVEIPFTFRYYQIQGILHLLGLRRMVLGDGTGLGKTVQTIGAFSYIWDKNPNMKALVVAPKSAIRQWADEIGRFTNGVKVFIGTAAKETKDLSAVDARKAIYEAWSAHEGPCVLILNYALLIRDWNHGGFQPLLPNGKPDHKKPVLPGLLDAMVQKHGKEMTAVLDEATAFKSMKTKTWEVVAYLSTHVNRVYALTATLLKNNLMEGYSIYKAICPRVFGTKTAFYDDYCFIEYQQTRTARIPIIKSYKNLDKFRETIRPVYLGRPKHEVSTELPALTTREISFELNKAEVLKYRDALQGILELGDGEIKEFSETKALTSLIYCQQIVNSLSLLKFKEGDQVTEWDMPEGHKVGSLSSKEQALIDLLQDELDGEKVIVFTRFESHLERLQKVLKTAGIKSVRISGKENDEKRRDAQKAFQDLQSDTQVIFITAAGSEAINLQAASGIVFYDMPWSWGDYVQILGRMIRIGSPHQFVLAYHLLAELPGVGKDRKSIDHHVLSLLRRKKNLVDKVLGEAAQGALKFEKNTTTDEDVLSTKGGIRELVKAMQGKDVT
jgi:SNF2 family DNA or RNA helicase